MRRERKVVLLIKTSCSVVDTLIFYYPCCLKCNIPISSHPRSASLSAQLVIFQLSAIVFRPFGKKGIMNKKDQCFSKVHVSGGGRLADIGVQTHLFNSSVNVALCANNLILILRECDLFFHLEGLYSGSL